MLKSHPVSIVGGILWNSLFYFFLFLFISLGLAENGSAQPKIGGKHVYILYPGLDTIWGSYLFVVSNEGQTPEPLSFPVMLPKETIDFQAQDTLSPQEIKLGTDGGVTVEKVFPPGETMIQISFKLPSNQGTATANFKTPYAYETFGVFVWQDSFVVNGPTGLQVQKGVNLSGRMFDTYNLSGGAAGQSLSFTFEGVPEGRSRLWIIGWIFAGILLVTGLTIAYFTRPNLKHSEELV